MTAIVALAVIVAALAGAGTLFLRDIKPKPAPVAAPTKAFTQEQCAEALKAATSIVIRYNRASKQARDAVADKRQTSEKQVTALSDFNQVIVQETLNLAALKALPSAERGIQTLQDAFSRAQAGVRLLIRGIAADQPSQRIDGLVLLQEAESLRSASVPLIVAHLCPGLQS